MVTQTFIINNKNGLHARPAGELAKIASTCRSDITLKIGEKKINPKSILNIMAAAIRFGTEIELACNGETETEDLKRLGEAIEQGLGE
ncbi:HPr family phosphocarrier protein [Anaerocolumna sp. AGMB13020]|uniref:HPr family phosphocarrier protein n=1 Tax=Anaerocolumna sp. AGMB13020 TaxID=3081750 RepID=UPI002953EB8B|nr:HPr family phosphocarrier protein [Anaerocolumna sp. AGMB13020]WOO38371.1 HPr family phosphocarrier protein [Anaerocolumna sp. AGMB13020]